MASVDIIIKVWNAVDYVLRAVEAITRSTRLPHRIVIVDDGSTPATLDQLRKLQGVTLIEHGSNMGSAAAARTGFQNTASDFVVLLDSDVIVQEDWLSRLVAYMSDPQVALVGPLRFSRFKYPGSVKSSQLIWEEVRARNFDPSLALDEFLGGRTLDQFGVDLVKYNRLSDEVVDAPPGFISTSCILLRRCLVDASGGVASPEFTSYGEDVDLCWRVGAAGYKIVRSSRVYVHHFEHASVEANNANRSALMEHGNRVLFEKWGHVVLELGRRYPDAYARSFFPFVALFREMRAKGSGQAF